MSTAAEWVFILAVVMLLFPHVGFPAIAFLRAWLVPRPVASGVDAVPVSVILAAYRESDVIGARIRNLLEQDYPGHLVQVIVACDGGDDGTYAAAREHATDNVEVLNLPRVGKAGAMNAGIAAARHDILAFTDANTIWAPNALRELVAPFADPDVGGVAGDQRYVGGAGTDAVAAGEGAYWSIDRSLKRALSTAGSVTSATGAIHALRREHVETVPGGVTDDFFLSTGAIAAGRRLVFVPQAQAFETLAPSRQAEFARKVRIMTRGLQAVRVRSALLNPRAHGFYALQLFSHKVLRRLAFIPLTILMLASLAGLWTVTWLAWAAAVQAGFYAVAIAGLLAPRGGGSRLGTALRLPAFFVLTYAAAAVAAVRVAAGRQVQQWGHDRQAHPQSPPPDGVPDASVAPSNPEPPPDPSFDPPPTPGGTVVAVVAPFVAAAAAWGILGAQPAVAATAAALGAAIAILGLPRPALAVPVALGLIYSNLPAIVSQRLGLPTAAVGFAITGLLALVVLRLLTVRGHALVLPPAVPWLLLYLGALTLSTLLTPLQSTAFDGVVEFTTEGLFLYLLIVNAIRDLRTLRRVLWTLAIVAALLASLSLVQAVTQTYHTDYLGLAQHGLEETGLPGAEDPVPRAHGPIGEQNRYAQVLLMVLPIPLLIALRHRKATMRAVAAVATLAAAGGIAVTASRGAAVAAMLVLVTMALLREVGAGALVAAVIGVALIVTVLPRAADRLVDTVNALTGADPLADVDGAVIGRLSSNLGAVRVFRDHPFTGVGPSNYPHYHKDAVEDLGLRVIPGRQPHNLYPQIGAESGVLGLLAFAGIVVATLRELWRVRRRYPRDSELGIFATGMFLAVLAYLYSAVFLHMAFQRYFWMLLALAAAVPIVGDQQQPTTQQEGSTLHSSGLPSVTRGETTRSC